MAIDFQCIPRDCYIGKKRIVYEISAGTVPVLGSEAGTLVDRILLKTKEGEEKEGMYVLPKGKIQIPALAEFRGLTDPVYCPEDPFKAAIRETKEEFNLGGLLPEKGGYVCMQGRVPHISITDITEFDKEHSMKRILFYPIRILGPESLFVERQTISVDGKNKVIRAFTPQEALKMIYGKQRPVIEEYIASYT